MCKLSLVPGACEKRKSAWYTLFVHVFNLPQDVGDSGLFSDSSVLCDVRVQTRYSILVRILQWRVTKVQISAQLLTSYTP